MLGYDFISLVNKFMVVGEWVYGFESSLEILISPIFYGRDYSSKLLQVLLLNIVKLVGPRDQIWRPSLTLRQFVKILIFSFFDFGELQISRLK